MLHGPPVVLLLYKASVVKNWR